MIRRAALAILVCSALALLAHGVRSAASPHGADESSVDPAPEMIGEGVISTPDDELGGNLTADGKTLYFEKRAPRLTTSISSTNRISLAASGPSPPFSHFPGCIATPIPFFRPTARRFSSHRIVL